MELGTRLVRLDAWVGDVRRALSIIPGDLTTRETTAVMNIEGTVREFLSDHTAAGQTPISSDESILDSGLLDSAGLFELVAFLEERFGVSIDDEELVPENFETIDAIVALVTKKTDAGQVAGEAQG